MRGGPGRKVFGIGLSRTGTRSLAAALKLLDLRTVHFPADPLTRREIGAYYADPAAPLRLTVMDAHDAAVDTPIASSFPGLDRAYPGSLFVYTTRPLADWLQSCEAYWDALLHPQLENPTIDPALLAYMRAVNRAVYGVEWFDRARFAAARERHDRAVRSHFRDRAGRLLVLPLCEGAGWEPLCAFLSRAAPGPPFPHRNRMPEIVFPDPACDSGEMVSFQDACGPETGRRIFVHLRSPCSANPFRLRDFRPSLAAPDRPMIGSAVFVARERELERLQGILAAALEGRGQVCFVAGEAGSGKTTLINEFTRRAQEAHRDLLVAFGDSNSQTGMADPYLPFREVMALLTGDVEGTLAEGAITEENAGRLRRFLDIAGSALVDSGADLVGIFVPGGSLLARVGARLAQQSGWTARLEALLKQKAEQPPGREARLDQNQIFEQFTSVIRRLATQAPLVLVLDDLHWVDAASAGLLFHLARRIEGSRILIVGSFRPNDVAVGRGGERHPLEPVLNELKRYYGDIVIDLGAADEAEGRRFVDELIDAEPNLLGPDFREALFRHTEGHPLFTVELLRSLQERGVLRRNPDGCCVLGPDPDWESLPARVDGVIGERIGRLEKELRDTLTVASVEGEKFTAEVIARVRSADERGVVRCLSEELERQHRLVAAQGVERLARRRLSLYRFRHSLFQKYLYHALDEVERSYLHEDVGRVLEELYEDRAHAIAVQLARHFLEAGDTEKAAGYFVQAGDTAAAAYANAEASLHYGKALELLADLGDHDENRRRRIDTTLKLVSCALVADAPERNLARLAAVEPLAAALPDPGGAPGGDRLRLARIRFWMGRFHHLANAPAEAIGYYRQVLAVAGELGDEELVAVPSSVIGRALVSQGHFGKALAMLAQAAAPLEKLGNWPEWLSTQGYLGVALSALGRYAEGVAAGERAVRRAAELNNPTGLALGHIYLFAAHLMAGNPQRMVQASRAAVEAAERSGDRMALYVGYGYRGWAEGRAGRYRAAAEYMARRRSEGERLGGRLVIADWFAAADAELALGAGRVEEALELAARAVELARSMGGIFAEGLAHRVWGEALAASDPGRWAEAEEHLAASVGAFAAGEALLPAAHAHLAWGRLCVERGDPAAAREHLEQAAAQFERSELAAELELTRRLLSGVPAPGVDSGPIAST